MDEEAKTRWQRAKPAGQIIGLPGYLVGGEWVGVGSTAAGNITADR
jgi:hypothetical protein